MSGQAERRRAAAVEPERATRRSGRAPPFQDHVAQGDGARPAPPPPRRARSTPRRQELLRRSTTTRPQTRADCVNGPRPCLFVSCKHNLYLDVNPETGSIKLNFPDKEIWELEHTCALDVAEKGGITLEEVGEIMNLTRERIRQVETRGLLKLREATEAEPSGSGRGSPRQSGLGRPTGRRAVRFVDTRRARVLRPACSPVHPPDPCSPSSASPTSADSSPSRRGSFDLGYPAPLHRRHARGAEGRRACPRTKVSEHTGSPGDPRRPGEDAPPARSTAGILGRPTLAVGRGRDGGAAASRPSPSWR